MTWVVLCGLDRSGKTTVAELYKKKGFKVIHFSAPDKKYYKPGYSGPSYLDEIVEMLIPLSGQDVLMDRSHYGERLWPYVYGREPLLTEDDIQVIRELEAQNNTQRILMWDEDIKAHWQRCVANNEPLTLEQFRHARELYKELAATYGFTMKSLKDYEDTPISVSGDTSKNVSMEGGKESEIAGGTVSSQEHAAQITPTSDNQGERGRVDMVCLTKEQKLLQTANAINDILSSRIVKRKGTEFDEIENKIRAFLNTELGKLFGTPDPNSLAPDEISVLKIFVRRLKEKEVGK